MFVYSCSVRCLQYVFKVCDVIKLIQNCLVVPSICITTDCSSTCNWWWIHSWTSKEDIRGLLRSKQHIGVFRNSDMVQGTRRAFVTDHLSLVTAMPYTNTSHSLRREHYGRAQTTVRLFEENWRTRNNVVCFRRTLPSRVNTVGYLRVQQRPTLSQYNSWKQS